MSIAGLSARQSAILDAMGIEQWRLRQQPAAASQSELPAVPTNTMHPNDAPAADRQPLTVPQAGPAPAIPREWSGLNAAIRGCKRCALHETRTNAVCGVGDTTADWLVVGEAPGADEDRQGEPFVGRAGQLLNEMLRAIGLRREQVYIANILKCRPPNNRDPLAEEIEQCLPFLQQQIELLQPKIVLVVGRIAAQTLLQVKTPVGKLRGSRHEYAGVPLVVTYHPAYLLRSPLEKSKAWKDLLLARGIVADSGV